jgi:hypothetical protein
MGLVSTGIDRVKAFELPAGIWADGRSVGAPRLALIRWHSSWSDKLYQIYVDGQYSATTVDSEQRQMIVQMPTFSETPVRMEVFAVEADESNIDLSDEIDLLPGWTGRVRLTLLRGQNLPVDSAARVYFDNGTGIIDYEHPLSDSLIRVWPAWQDKAGFGMASFGVGDFAYDSAASVGFGKGTFGRSQFGLDADTFEWTSPPLRAGVYRFAVKISNSIGNESSCETDQITVIPAARPAEHMRISSFDEQTNQLVLSIS